MSKIGKKIAIIMVFVAVGGLLIISFFLNYRLEENFNKYLYQEKIERINEFVSLIENRYDAGSSWSRIEEIMINLNSLNGFDIFITDKNQNLIIVNTQGKRGNMSMGPSQMMGRNGMYNNHYKIDSYNKIELENDGEIFAHLYWKLPSQQRLDSEQGRVFVENMNKIIVITAFIIIIITIIISLIFSKYLTVPILKMNSYANKVAEGDFRQKLSIRGNDELTELGQSLNEMTEKLNHLNKIRKKSTSDLAHELRTPLAGIKSYLEGIEDGVLKADNETFAELNEELDRLVQLVERLGKLNEAERKKVYMEKEKIEVNQMLINLLQRFEKKAKNNNVEIINDLSDNKLFVFTEEEILDTIFSNLISNAIKYNIKGGYVKIASKEKDNFAVIEIKDNGIGIDKQDLPYIFERFYRGDSSRSNEISGTGIGLAVVRELVEALSGEIYVESDEKATIFKIYLPLDK